ncbi:hypothetical protein L6452_43937 [Arctium lappa]|uniref:Uncharacterized protein n=1 Tax=Arctium lappa TaxID=4217 RepID=A0ACB8XEU3_ARCLA|nr:hypothetical protein L6452_43937 [Arctium lappa]
MCSRRYTVVADLFQNRKCTVEDIQLLQMDESNGTEIGRTIKKFPLLTPREYILAWRLCKGIYRNFYCYCKECDHHLAPRQKKYVRVGQQGICFGSKSEIFPWY